MRPADTPSADRRSARRLAGAALAALVALNLVLGLHDLAHALPYVFHSDYVQLEQAVQLLRNGWFTDQYDYPLPMVFVYAAAAAVTFGVLHPAGGWSTFVEHFADPAVSHVVGRAVSVLCGALLVVATYRLARVRFARGVALLAAAAVACDPVLVLSAHQVRPHVPAVLLMVLAAPSILRLVLPATAGRGAPRLRDGALAGAWIGLGAAVFQVAALQIVAALLLVAACVRPLRRACALGAAVVAGMLASTALISLLAHAPAAVRPLPGSHFGDDTQSLSLPARLLSWGLASRFAESGPSWLAAEPVLIAAVALAAVLALRARLRSQSAAPAAALPQGAGAEVAPAQAAPGGHALVPLDLLLYGALPLVILCVMGVLHGAHVRYLLAATPYLAVLAAAACLAPRAAGARVLCAALLVGAPLAMSVRALALLHTVDTRVALDALLSELSEGAAARGGAGAQEMQSAPGTVALQDSLVLDRGALPRGVFEFPAWGDIARWGETTLSPRAALKQSGAVAYARVPGAHWAAGPLDGASLQQLGFRLYGTLGDAPRSRLYLPDIPDALCPDLWITQRTGPPIELWVADGAAGTALRARLAEIAAPEALATWTGEAEGSSGTAGGAAGSGARGAVEDPAAASVAAAVARAEARRRAPAQSAPPGAPGGAPAGDAPGLAHVDLDGDGVPEAVASNVEAAQLQRLLTLPAERWHAAGGALGKELSSADPPATTNAAPSLVAHGTLQNDEPVLLLLRGARPGALCHLVLGLHEARTSFRGGVLVPAPDFVVHGLRAGPQGDLALAALWPHGLPAKFPVCAQVWIEDSDGPRGFTASNAVAGTSPD